MQARAGVIAAGAAGILLVSLGGCASTGDVEQQWTANISKLGVTPVYPPREGIYVGNIFMVLPERVQPETKRGTLSAPSTPRVVSEANRSVLFDSLGLGITADQATQSDAIDWPPMTSYNPEGSHFIWAPPTMGTQSPPATREKRILRLVSFPAFALASGTVGSLGLNAPTGALGAKVATSFTNNTVVTVSIPAAESYSYPLAQQLGKLSVVCANNNWAAIAKSLSAQTSELNLVVVTEVFYARVIDVDMSFADSWSGGGAVVPEYLAQLSQERTQRSAQIDKQMEHPDVIAVGETKTNRTLAEENQEAIIRISKQMADMLPQVPGIKGEVTHASSTGVRLQSAFRYPVAIGYRGAQLKVDTTTCQATSIGGAGSTLLYQGDPKQDPWQTNGPQKPEGSSQPKVEKK